MLNKDEALTLALKALEAAEELAAKHDAELEHGFRCGIIVIKDALASTSTTCEVQLEQEPVEWMRFHSDMSISFAPSKEQQSCDKREWVGLTDEEQSLADLCYADCTQEYIDGYRAGMDYASSTLKEKNT